MKTKKRENKKKHTHQLQKIDALPAQKLKSENCPILNKVDAKNNFFFLNAVKTIDKT